MEKLEIAPTFVEQMYTRYVSRRETDLNLLRASLQSNSTDHFKRIGHQIMGNARSFGFSELENLAERMENVQREHLSAVGPALIQEFADWIEQAKQTYKL